MADAKIVTGLIVGIGGLILTTILIFVIVGTLIDSGVVGNPIRTYTMTVSYENNSFINSSIGGALTGPDRLGIGSTSNSSESNFAITGIWNSTKYGYSGTWTGAEIQLGNYTLSTSTGNLTNATSVQWPNVTVSYTYTYTLPSDKTTFAYDNKYQTSLVGLGENFTGGVDNVSDKFPTILLISAVVLLFGVIIFLVQQSKNLGIGESSL